MLFLYVPIAAVGTPARGYASRWQEVILAGGAGGCDRARRNVIV